MKRATKFLFFILACASGVRLMAQTQDSYEYNSEFTWGINKNSFGGLIGGFTVKKARRINKTTFETFGLELMNVKNPHEVRLQASSGNYFIYGKQNYLYAIRLQYGRDVVLFTKGPQQGVEIKAVMALGPTVGIVSPYYVQYSQNSASAYTSNVPYNGTQAYGDIQGTGTVLEGISESKIQMGGNLKLAFNFELGTLKSQVTGFEAGFLLDAYTSKVPIMYQDPTNPKKAPENYAIYPTVFLTIFYGGRK